MYNNMKLLLSEVLRFDKKKRLGIDQVKEKVKNINTFDNSSYNLEGKIIGNIKDSNHFSDFEINELVK